MQIEKLRDHAIPLAGVRRGGPVLDGLLSVQRNETLEPRGQRGRIGEEVRVFALEELDAERARKLEPDARRLAHRREQRLGDLQRADALALRFDVDGARRIESLQRFDELALERLLRGLRIDGEVAEQRSAMARNALEIEHLRAFVGERGDQAALAGAREPADDAIVEVQRQRREQAHHVAPVRAIAARELDGAPTDFVQHVRQRPAALSAAPAIHERRPIARLVAERAFEHRRDVAGDDGGAGLARGERRIARVQRSDPRALVVVEHRLALRAGDVVDRELGGAAHVDALAIVGERVDRHAALGAIRDDLGSPRTALRAAPQGGERLGAALRRSSRLPEKRGELRPHVVDEQRLCGGGRMDAIGLEHLVALAEAFEKERNERRLVRFRDVGEERAELPRHRRHRSSAESACRR